MTPTTNRHRQSQALTPAKPEHRPVAIQWNQAKPRSKPMLTFAILVPDRDILHLYFRPESGRLRYAAPVLPHQLFEHLSIPEPSVVALAGNHAADRVSQALLYHHDFLVVPDVWLTHIPDRDFSRRARTAARLVHAHLLDPIQLRLAPAPDDIPF